jgi:hypothetical protein
LNVADEAPGFVRLAAGAERKDLRKRLRKDAGEIAREVQDRAGEQARMEVVELDDAPPDHVDDLRMRVAEDRAHLARCEVEDGPPLAIVDVGARRTLDHGVGEIAAVAKHVMRIHCGRPPDLAEWRQ